MWLYPPRPEKAVPPALIAHFEHKGWIAQRKKNGTCQVIFVDADGNVSFFTRHNEPNKAWKPLDCIRKKFVAFPDSVFVGELLHSKGPSVKNTIILFDVLRLRGEDLVGKSLADRLAILSQTIEESRHIGIIDTYEHDFTKLYESLTDPLDEGIVLKDPKAVLRNCHRDGLNSSWQVKCRKPTKNFAF
jgi:hypothetical protein